MENGKILLLVEDEPDVRMILRWRLMTHAFRIEEAVDGATGLMLAKKLKPTLMVLDIMLPRMDGFEVYRALRQDTRTQKVPVLFLTAALSSSGYVSKEGLASVALSKYGMKLEGVYDVLAKPYNNDQLEGKIRRLLEMAKLSQQKDQAV